LKKGEAHRKKSEKKKGKERPQMCSSSDDNRAITVGGAAGHSEEVGTRNQKQERGSGEDKVQGQGRKRRRERLGRAGQCSRNRAIQARSRYEKPILSQQRKGWGGNSPYWSKEGGLAYLGDISSGEEKKEWEVGEGILVEGGKRTFA